MIESDHQGTKELVKKHYATIAQGAQCCDSSGELNVATLYSKAELEELPIETVAASAGCGNPTALASLKPGEVVLDLGSGGGIDCFLAARAVGPAGKVIGLDMTPDMVSLAKKNAERLGISNVQFYLAEMERMPLESESVDVAISNCVICLSPDKDAVFAEVYRVLRLGGRVHISDMVLLEELPQEITSDPEKWVSCIAGAELKDTYVERMRKVGFTDIEVTAEEATSDSEGWRTAVRSMRITARKGH